MFYGLEHSTLYSIFGKLIIGMLFKHPELFWALFLLIIPILIHLFQLRKFQNTPFTNVKLLEKVISKSRKSSTLKKWLLLLTRLCFLLALILAFTRPYLANTSIAFKREMVIYLDNSFSMQARINNISSLEKSVQEIIQTIPADMDISLFTNKEVFQNTTVKGLRESLMALDFTYEQLDYNQIILKGKSLFSKEENAIKNLILISDFQSRDLQDSLFIGEDISIHHVRTIPDDLSNVSIDSAYIRDVNISTKELWVNLSSQSELETIPVSLFDKDRLIAKNAAKFDENKTAEVLFTLPPAESIQGTITISDAGLSYDNQFFFNLNKKEQIRVLAIGNEDSGFLGRIFTKDDFIFLSTDLKNINYSELAIQNLIILNEVEALPNSLKDAISVFLSKGGNLVIIPALEGSMSDYNSLIPKALETSLNSLVKEERSVTDINFNHPIYRSVFTQSVQNFQFPKVQSYFELKTKLPSIINFQDKSPFLVGNSSIYIFSAPLSSPNSTFKNSPLIVPTFYNIGTNSLKLSNLFFEIGGNNEVDIPVSLGQDDVLKLLNADFEFIPNQIRYPTKTTIKFIENPNKDGIYAINNKVETLQHIAFNYDRAESIMDYPSLETLNAASLESNLTESFKNIEKELSITELWKWFIIFAIIFMLCEVLIQKFIK